MTILFLLLVLFLCGVVAYMASALDERNRRIGKLLSDYAAIEKDLSSITSSFVGNVQLETKDPGIRKCCEAMYGYCKEHTKKKRGRPRKIA